MITSKVFFVIFLNNVIQYSSEDLDRQAAMAIVSAQQKLSVQSNVYRKPSADTRQMVENPDARFADFGQAETLKFAEKHAVKAYEKEQTKLANKRKREEQKEENIRITKAKYTEAIQNPACVLGIPLCECFKKCHL